MINISKESKISGHYSGDDNAKLSGSVSGSGKLNMKSGGGAAESGTWGGSIEIDSQGKLSGSGIGSAGGHKGTWNGIETGGIQSNYSSIKITTSTSFKSDESSGNITNIYDNKSNSIILECWQ